MSESSERRILLIVDPTGREDLANVTRLASRFFDIPDVMITLLEDSGYDLRTLSGAAAYQLRRDVVLAAQTIELGARFVVENVDHHLGSRQRTQLAGEPKVRFYASAPIRNFSGKIVGTFSLVDGRRRTMGAGRLKSLETFADVIAALLARPADDANRTADAWAAQARLVSEQATSLALQKRVLDSALRLAKMGAWELDLKTGRYTWSDTMYDLHEIPRDTDIANPSANIDRFYLPADRRRVAKTVKRFRQSNVAFAVEAQMRTAKDQLRWTRLTGEVEFDKDGVPLRRFGIKQDITDEKLMLQRITALAERDELTGIYNRSELVKRLKAFSADRAAARELALFMVDLDGFKAINDEHGHAAGDICLQRIAKRLEQLAIGPKVVARLGGDEFAVLVGRSKPSEIDVISKKLVAEITRSIRSPIGVFRLGASVGISVRSAGRRIDVDAMLREADLAMYAAKRTGIGGYRMFRPRMLKETNYRLKSLDLIREALAHGRLLLYYQPIHRMRDTSLVGFEALLRWHHPDGTIRAPGEFLAALEDNQLSVEIGDFVVRSAVDQAAAWHRRRLSFGQIAINAGTNQLSRPHFAKKLLAAVRSSGLKPAMFTIEVTENVFLTRTAGNVLAACRALKAGGIGIAFDDFGTGFASLTHLRDLPVDKIKLDRSFISRIGKEAATPAIVQAIVSLAHTLSMSVVAEGVETEAQADFLKAIDCDMAQGYLYGRPVPPFQAESFCTGSLRPEFRRLVG